MGNTVLPSHCAAKTVATISELGVKKQQKAVSEVCLKLNVLVTKKSRNGAKYRFLHPFKTQLLFSYGVELVQILVEQLCGS